MRTLHHLNGSVLISLGVRKCGLMCLVGLMLLISQPSHVDAQHGTRLRTPGSTGRPNNIRYNQGRQGWGRPGQLPAYPGGGNWYPDWGNGSYYPGYFDPLLWGYGWDQGSAYEGLPTSSVRVHTPGFSLNVNGSSQLPPRTPLERVPYQPWSNHPPIGNEAWQQPAPNAAPADGRAASNESPEPIPELPPSHMPVEPDASPSDQEPLPNLPRESSYNFDGQALEASARLLELSLRHRDPSGQWRLYLRLDAVIESALTRDIEGDVNGALERFETIAGDPQWEAVQEVAGFRQTLNLLRQWTGKYPENPPGAIE